MNKIVCLAHLQGKMTSKIASIVLMRIFLLFIGIGLGAVYANPSYAQTKISIDANGITYEELFEQIQGKSEFIFFYKDNVLNPEKKVFLNLKKAELSTILDRVFGNTDLDYSIDDRQVVIKKRDILIETGLSLPVILQDFTVSGTITDTDGQPLPGANILEKGTTKGTTTDMDGSYKIEVDTDAILVFSYLGFVTREIQVDGRERIDVSLQPDAAQLEGITLTGIRASQQRAVAIKKNSTVFVEAITSEDAGKLPDRNVAEALQRVSGVAIQRSRGQGDFISIRGLGPEFARGTMNGRTLVSATENFDIVLSGGVGSSTGRATNFDVLPSELIESIEVFKTNAAEQVEGGLAGTVNINTSKPLKVGKKYGISTRTPYNGFAKKSSPSISAFGSWANENRTFGFLGSVAYSKRNIRQDATRTYAYFPASFFGDPAGFDTNSDGTADVNEPYFPFSGNLDTFDEERKRLTFSGTLQWAPSENTTITLDASQSNRDLFTQNKQILLEVNPSFGRTTADNGYVINTDGSVQYPLGLEVDGSNTAVRFGSEGAGYYGAIGAPVIPGIFEQDSKDKLFSSGLNLKHLSGDWKFNFDASLASTSSDYAFIGGYTQEQSATNSLYSVDLSQDVIDIDASYSNADGAVDISDPNNYALRNFDINGTNIKDREMAFQGDTEVALGGNFFSAVKFGARYRTRKRENSKMDFFGQQPFTTGDNSSLLSLNLGASGIATTRFPGNFLNGDFKGLDLSQIPIVEDINLWKQAHETAGGNFPVVNDPNNTYEVKENTFGGYAQFDIDTKIGEVKLTGNAGVRLVNTKIDIDGNAQELAQVAVGNGPLQFSQFVGDPIPYRQSNSYFKVLPSVNIKAEATENIFVRAAYSRSITRPQFNDLAGVSINFTQNLVNKAGNPNLLPYESSNYDFGIDWYTGKGGLIGISFFYKDLSNFITNVTRSNETFIGNVWTSFLTRENQGKGNIRGTEIAFQQPLSFLPGVLEGLGIIANFTFVNGEQTLNTGAPVAFPGISNFSYNTALFYDNGGKFQSRLAYTYRDKFLILANDVFAQEQWVNDYGQLDASVSYEITDGITVFGEAVNLGNSRNKLFTSNRTSPALNGERPVSTEHVGVRYGIGVRAIF